MNGKKYDLGERRKYKRYLVKNGAYTINSTKPGLIIDIGIGGLSIHYIDRKCWPNESFELDIIFGEDDDFRLANVPYNVISDDVTKTELSNDSLVVKRRSVEFGDLNEEQLEKLQFFINNNSIQEIC